MRRRSPIYLNFLALTALACLAVVAQERPINPRIPPPPPPTPEATPAPSPAPASRSTPAAPVSPAAGLKLPVTTMPAAIPSLLEAPPSPLPATASIPNGTRIPVVLDTPLSTRITHKGQPVTFRTSEPLRLGDLLTIPPETAFDGSVIEMRRPGAFGKSGVIRVRVDRVNLLGGASTPVTAHLDSPDMKGGKLKADNPHSTDILSLASYTLQGTLLGSQIKGGKGAAVGAGAGAAVAMVIMMSHKGGDVYLEPGMPFSVILDQPVELPGAQVYAAQQSYARAHRSSASSGALSNSSSASAASAAGDTSGRVTGSEIERNPDNADLDSDRPKLKHRPKNPAP